MPGIDVPCSHQCPGGHSSQVDELEFAEYDPAAHGVADADALGQKLPAGQVEVRGDDEPAPQ